MGRLFWKVFGGFWIAMLLTAGVAALAVYRASLDDSSQFDTGEVQNQALYANRYVGEHISRYAAVLAYGGEAPLRELMNADTERRSRRSDQHFRPSVIVVNEQGNEILERPVPQASLIQARQRISRQPDDASIDGPGKVRRLSARGVESVGLADGKTWLLFMPRTDATELRRPPRPWWRDVSPEVAGLLALAFSFMFSGALAWYLARPIRALRDGFRQVASGRLDTRVASQIGRRRDELADLGVDFDKTTARLEALIKAQKQLLHDVSHELRSPLARMQAATGLLEQTPERAPELIARIEQETARLDALVGEILTLSRLDEQQHTRPQTRFDLADLLADLAQDAQFEAEACGKKVELISKVEGDVQGDPSLIQRACENLVRNAIRYSPDGETVVICAELIERKKPAPDAAHERQICITVTDAGPGLAEHELQEVIKPFNRGSQTEQDGFGLGLAITRRALEIHGGALELSNRQDRSGLVAKLVWAG